MTTPNEGSDSQEPPPEQNPSGRPPPDRTSLEFGTQYRGQEPDENKQQRFHKEK
jgi:hypothetical protein